MKKIKCIVIMLFTWLTLGSYTNASGWNLPGIDIISRAERGAEESRRIREGGTSNIDDIVEEFQEENNGHHHDQDITLPTPVNPYQIAEEFIRKNYPEDIAIDEIIEEQNGKIFIRPLEYRYKKKAIVIHHTASNQKKIQENGIISHLQNIYKFHSKTRGRGDIGYHFLIDENGNIYEGRAGGQNVIGAHTKRNNPNTIGIALIGNFQETEPTKEQLNATIKLSAALANKYNISPDQKVTFHERSDTSPYIKQNTHSTIIGHQDAGNTSCPGEKLYNKLDEIREGVKKQLLANKIEGTIANIYYMNNHHLAVNDTAAIILPYEFEEVKSCENIEDESREIQKCSKSENGLELHVKQNRKPTFGTRLLSITNENNEKVVYYISIIRQNDIDNLLANRTKKTQTNNPDPIQKIEHKITQTEVAQLLREPIRVLLYELSTSKTKRDFSCSNTCKITTPERTRTGNNITVHLYDDNTIFVGNTQTGNLTTKANIQSTESGGIVQITNYERKSYAGIPRNVFKGNIDIQKENLQNITLGEQTKQFSLINELNIIDYLQGIAESNDQEPIEKTKALAILAKQYAVFYLHPGNTHPNIDSSNSYQAIDDPRSFQKYVGAGFEDTSKKRKQAVEATQNTYVLFNGFLPILPYFSCSPGYTKSAEQNRGWTDTPYLQTVIDFSKNACQDFQGHGVGLSGRGATHLAQVGLSYDQILKHYYQGIQIQQIFF